MAVYGAQRKWCSGDAGPLLKENWTVGGPPPFAARDPTAKLGITEILAYAPHTVE
jgi:hypothetical protein